MKNSNIVKSKDFVSLIKDGAKRKTRKVKVIFFPAYDKKNALIIP